MILAFLIAQALAATKITPLTPLLAPKTPPKRTYVAPVPGYSATPIPGAMTPSIPENTYTPVPVTTPTPITGGVEPKPPENVTFPSFPEGGIVPSVPGSQSVPAQDQTVPSVPKQ